MNTIKISIIDRTLVESLDLDPEEFVYQVDANDHDYDGTKYTLPPLDSHSLHGCLWLGVPFLNLRKEMSRVSLPFSNIRKD